MALNFIKKLWNNETDESVHQQFVRFSRGTFENRAVINFRKNGKVRISSTFEYANSLVLLTASFAGKIKVNGILLSKEKIDLEGEKKKKNIFQYEISKEMSFQEISEISKKAYFMLFDCEAPGLELKIKKKLPQPGKGRGEKINDKFCVLDADIKYAEKIKDEFFFDIPEFKKAKITHSYIIEDIVIPAGEKDPEQMRLRAKRKGKITRKLEFDGKQEIKEKAFIA